MRFRASDPETIRAFLIRESAKLDFPATPFYLRRYAGDV